MKDTARATVGSIRVRNVQSFNRLWESKKVIGNSFVQVIRTSLQLL